MPLYHCTHRILSAGDLIQPGNWGKKIFEIGVNHPCWKREMALEAVRSLHFPNKPSRFQSTFACETLEAIKAYKNHHCPTGYIYEVEAVNTVNKHRGDFNAVQPLAGSSYDMLQIADMYWRHAFHTSVVDWPGVQCIELLFDSSLRVIRNLPD